jgi:hypothetical protein
MEIEPYIFIHICASMYIYINKYLCIFTFTYTKYIYRAKNGNWALCVNAYVSTFVCMYIYIRTHRYAYIYMYM